MRMAAELPRAFPTLILPMALVRRESSRNIPANPPSALTMAPPSIEPIACMASTIFFREKENTRMLAVDPRALFHGTLPRAFIVLAMTSRTPVSPPRPFASEPPSIAPISATVSAILLRAEASSIIPMALPMLKAPNLAVLRKPLRAARITDMPPSPLARPFGSASLSLRTAVDIVLTAKATSNNPAPAEINPPDPNIDSVFEKEVNDADSIMKRADIAPRAGASFFGSISERFLREEASRAIDPAIKARETTLMLDVNTEIDSPTWSSREEMPKPALDRSPPFSKSSLSLPVKSVTLLSSS